VHVCECLPLLSPRFSISECAACPQHTGPVSLLWRNPESKKQAATDGPCHITSVFILSVSSLRIYKNQLHMQRRGNYPGQNHVHASRRAHVRWPCLRKQGKGAFVQNAPANSPILPRVNLMWQHSACKYNRKLYDNLPCGVQDMTAFPPSVLHRHFIKKECSTFLNNFGYLALNCNRNAPLTLNHSLQTITSTWQSHP